MRRLILWLAFGIVGAAPPALPPPGPPATTLVLRPAHVPRPALKYHLVPERYGLVPGNAALFYHRATLLLAQQQDRDVDRPQAELARTARRNVERLEGLAGKRSADFPRDEVRALLEGYRAVLNEIELGARRDHCDWGLDHRDEGVGLLLPEIQETRTLARLVALQAQLAIADGQLDRAAAAIETGLALGRHVADGPSLIQAIIGAAIDSLMARCLEALIEAPDAPSLFWALADRPRPFVDLRAALESERHIIEQEFPTLVELDRGVWSIEQARRLAGEMEAKIFKIIDANSVPDLDAVVRWDMSPTTRRLGIAALCARIEPEARRTLIRDGRSPAEVEAMPIVQAAMLATYRQARDRRDAMFRWANVPYPSVQGRSIPAHLTPEEKQANPLLAIFAAFDPVLNPARLVAVRVERQLDALQVVEAVRLDATRHGGRLPARLEAIADLPVPADPATGQPFEYRVEGDAAIIATPNPPEGGMHPSYAIQIRLVPPPR